MIGRLLFLMILSAATLAHAGPASWPVDAVGQVVYREGKVEIAPGGRASPWLRPRDHVVTGADGRAFILLRDGATLILGQDADCSVEAYRADPPDTGQNPNRLACAKGSFLYAASMGGLDAKIPIRITTRLAVIGTSGTVWAGMADTFGVFAHRGAASLSTGKGRMLLKEGQGSLLTSASGLPSRPSAWPPERLTASLATVRLRDAKALAAALAAARLALPQAGSQGGD